MRYAKLLPLLISTAIMISFVSKLAASGGLVASAAAAENAAPLKIDKLDAGADRIIPGGAMLERIATGFTWVEGPVWVKDSLYFADIPANSIHKWTPGEIGRASCRERV